MKFFNLIRKIKNNIVRNRTNVKFFIFIINLPLLGNIYDYFYFKHIKKTITKSDIFVTIEPNNICNLKCIMCPYQRMKRKKETMSLVLFKKIVDEAKELGCKEIHLTQYNEPFTDKLLFKRLSYIREKGMKSSFYSNAMLLDSVKREKLLKAPADLIRFSIDGIKKETQESIRKGSNYEMVVENVTSLYKERNKAGQKLPIIEVFFTFLENNKNEAKEFQRFWKDKCDFISIYPADSRESNKFVGINYKKLKPYPCFNPKRITVLSNGKVTLCCIDMDGGIVLGDLKKQSLKEIFNSKRYKEIYESQLKRECKIPLCLGCSKYYLDSAFSWWLY